MASAVPQMSASAGMDGNDFNNRQTEQQSAHAIRMSRNKSAPEAFRKVEKDRLVVLAAVFARLMHQFFGETVRALNSDGILTAFRPTANRFVRAMSRFARSWGLLVNAALLLRSGTKHRSLQTFFGDIGFYPPLNACL